MTVDPKEEKPLSSDHPDYDPSGILADRAKGIYHNLSSPTPTEAWWERPPARPLSNVLWIDDDGERETALRESMPPAGLRPPPLE
jgi:hypothetical protein